MASSRGCWVQQRLGAEIPVFKSVHGFVHRDSDLLQAELLQRPGIALVPFPVGGQAAVAVDEPDLAAAAAHQVLYPLIAAGLKIRHHAAEAGFLPAHHLDHRQPAAVQVPQQPGIPRRSGDEDAVHKAVAQPPQSFPLDLGIVLGAADQRGIAPVPGLLFRRLHHIGKAGQVQPGHHHPDGVALALPQPPGQHVGAVAQLLHRRIDAGLGIGVDIPAVVQRPGYRAHIHTGPFGHILECCHAKPPSKRFPIFYQYSPARDSAQDKGAHVGNLHNQRSANYTKNTSSATNCRRYATNCRE